MTWMATTDRFSVPTGALRMALFLELLERFPPARLVDLGTGHGMFARLAADRGWEVTAVDARAERFPNDSRVRWVNQDIREISLDDFDMVACLGLWYHLTLTDQEGLVERAAGTPLIIDTHVAHDRLADHRSNRRALSKVKKVGDYSGRYYGERHLQDRFTASFGNDLSFWPTEESLRAMLIAGPYDLVESIDPHVTHDRRFFLATSIGSERARVLDEAISRYIPWEAPGQPGENAHVDLRTTDPSYDVVAH
jgi:SAM-dependent methyltransferase